MIDTGQCAVGDHLGCTRHTVTADFFGGLEEESHIAFELARGKFFFEQMRHAEQNRRVRVMAAGVHFAGIDRPKPQARRLVDGQRVHVGAYADRRAVSRPQITDDTRDADVGAYRDAANFTQRF